MIRVLTGDCSIFMAILDSAKSIYIRISNNNKLELEQSMTEAFDRSVIIRGIQQFSPSLIILKSA